MILSHPSDILSEYLSNIPPTSVLIVPEIFTEIIKNRRDLKIKDCELLAKFFKTSYFYWLNMQIQYDVYIKSKKLRVEMFDNWISGKSIQYKLGGNQWHNLTENSLKYLQRSDIELREKPKLVEVDGMFLEKEYAIKFIESNY